MSFRHPRKFQTPTEVSDTHGSFRHPRKFQTPTEVSDTHGSFRHPRKFQTPTEVSDTHQSVLVALGSNQGDRRRNLRLAVWALRELAAGPVACSPVYESPAVLPEGHAIDRVDPFFLNLVVQFSYCGSPADLLGQLQGIERELGREKPQSLTWAPRPIDLDIIAFGERVVTTEDLEIPHPHAFRRPFVVRPWRDLDLLSRAAEFDLLSRSRALTPMPQWMAVANLTPDSFSDGGCLEDRQACREFLETCREYNVGVVDFGPESTRPIASQRIDVDEQWRRLEPNLVAFREMFGDDPLAPKMSIDTRDVAVMERAYDYGARVFNDVSGMADPDVSEFLGQYQDIEYVLMHSVSLPPRPDQVLLTDDVAGSLEIWVNNQLEKLEKAGVNLGRIWFDPGIGFGKTPQQNMRILQQVEKFQKLPVRLLVGASRKSFLNQLTEQPATDRDFESAGVSVGLAAKGVDMIRVHRPDAHVRAWRAFQAVVG